ncbi:MAG: hypothetical protein Q8Q88_07015 [Phenylobacterium sp.]|uniref:hypothetical protein n=1 Tax=Phenylobacterium sp. TaxID=1871053 RepID=UPI00273238CE|nr:hypothetical protein [Phenylobacterium sp.]MDP3746786.1 hypothetical protein [Phenylobacterium sp.]
MDPGPDLEHHHHHHTGRRWLDIVLGVSAITISVISLFVAVHHGKTMEQMVEATTWPYVDFAFSSRDANGAPGVSLFVMNSGVGPAKIESFEIFHGGRAIENGRALLDACCQGDGEERAKYMNSSVSDRVLPAKETIVFFLAKADGLSAGQMDRLRKVLPELTARICYCSVLHECWIRDSSAPGPEETKSCAAPKVAYNDK